MAAEVPNEERSVREREEFVHFRASEVVWMESIGDRQVQLHLMDGRAVVLRGELWRALGWFQELGYPFVRTHRQVVVRMDRVTGAEQA
jgi:hypothetical protein